jgi:hypothetical protein
MKSPYTLAYVVRLCAAYGISLTYFAGLAALSIAVDLPLDREYERAPTLVAFLSLLSLTVILSALTLAVLLVLALAKTSRGLSKPDPALTTWASTLAGFPIRVYRSSWGSTGCHAALLRHRGRIYLGSETLLLLPETRLFVLLHEIAHLSAPGARLRTLASGLLAFFDVLEKFADTSRFTSKRAATVRSTYAVLRNLRRPRELSSTFISRCVRPVAYLLIIPSEIVEALLGPSVRIEELYADSIAASWFGERSNRAMLDAALTLSKASDPNCRARVIASGLEAWSIHGACNLSEAMRKGVQTNQTLHKTERKSWYPTWRERYIVAVAASREKRSGRDLLPPIDFEDTSVVVGDFLDIAGDVMTVASPATLGSLLTTVIKMCPVALAATVFFLHVGTEFKHFLYAGYIPTSVQIQLFFAFSWWGLISLRHGHPQFESARESTPRGPILETMLLPKRRFATELDFGLRLQKLSSNDAEVLVRAFTLNSEGEVVPRKRHKLSWRSRHIREVLKRSAATKTTSDADQGSSTATNR